MVERYLFLLLTLMGAVAVYYDQDLIYHNWIGPAIVGGPFLAWLISGFVQRGRREKKEVVEPTSPKESLKKEREEVPAARGTEEGEGATRLSLEDVEEHANEYRKEGVLWLLSVFQREGRLVDFIQEDISPYDDAQIGAACREIHQGLKKALQDVLEFTPVVEAQEGSDIEVDEDYDPRQIRLTGNLSGEAPFKGSLVHPGWKVEEVRLPKFSDNVRLDIITQAEIEVR